MDLRVDELVSLYEERTHLKIEALSEKLINESRMLDIRIQAMQDKLLTLAEVQKVRSEASEVFRGQMHARDDVLSRRLEKWRERVEVIDSAAEKTRSLVNSSIGNAKTHVDAINTHFTALESTVEQTAKAHDAATAMLKEQTEKTSQKDYAALELLREDVDSKFQIAAETNKDGRAALQRAQDEMDDKIDSVREVIRELRTANDKADEQLEMKIKQAEKNLTMKMIARENRVLMQLIVVMVTSTSITMGALNYFDVKIGVKPSIAL